jgi:Tol biopolymer transport system component
MPAAGGEPIQVTSGGFVGDGYVDLSFSPDGQSIAFTSNQSGNKDVWIVPAEGGEPRQVTLTAEDDIWLDFSPDGREIVFTSGTPDNVDLWVVPATGWTARNLVDWPTNEGDPQWSPDGERIAFTSSRTHEDLTRSIWVMPAGGGEATYVAAGQMPDWSPDGKTLLFIRGNDIWSIPAAGGKPARLTQTQDEEIRPRFSPDGSHILFSATRLQADIWIADVSGLEVLT